MGYLSGWKSRIKLTIDHTKIDEDLSNFPLLITLVSGSHDVFFEELSYTNRKKIIVTAGDGVTQCYVEIEDFVSDSKALLWTKVSTVVSGSDTILYLYYDSSKDDNITYVGDIGSTVAQNVWDDNFSGVWHMNQDPTGGAACIKDSTSNINHGTPGGSMTSGDLVDGKIGKAIDFDGTDDYIILTQPIADILESKSTGWAIETWLKGSDTDESFFFDSRTSDNNDEVRQQLYNSRVMATYDDDTYGAVDAVDLTDYTGSYHYIVTTINSSILTLYVDGISKDTGDVSGVANLVNLSPPSIGERQLSGGHNAPGNAAYFTGIIDEVRISNTARSAPWIKATYHSNWDTLITYTLYAGYFSGYVFEQNNPVSRKLYLHDRLAGDLVTTTTSSGNGYYYMETASSGSHYIVCLDDDAGVEYNDLIIGSAFPLEVT